MLKKVKPVLPGARADGRANEQTKIKYQPADSTE